MTNDEAASEIAKLADKLMENKKSSVASVLYAAGYAVSEPDHSLCLARHVAEWMVHHEPDKCREVMHEVLKKIAESN